MEKVLFGVNGTLMRGPELNANLLNVGAVFVREAATSTSYRMWSINDQHPAMMRDTNGGGELSLEVWELTAEALLQVLQQEPPGLCVGRIELQDQEWILGVLGEPYICEGQLEITAWGGWRNYASDSRSP